MAAAGVDRVRSNAVIVVGSEWRSHLDRTSSLPDRVTPTGNRLGLTHFAPDRVLYQWRPASSVARSVVEAQEAETLPVYLVWSRTLGPCVADPVNRI